MASARVSFGWVCTKVGRSPPLVRKTSSDRLALGQLRQEPVLRQPLVVEDLREVSASGVGQHHHDHVIRR